MEMLVFETAFAPCWFGSQCKSDCEFCIVHFMLVCRYFH